MNNQFIKADNDSVNKNEINIGDRVRLRIKRQLFEKNSQAIFTKTLHTVERYEDGLFFVRIERLVINVKTY